MLEIELMFGRNIGGKVGVTEEQWTEFVAGEITPRFPDGLSVDDALGNGAIAIPAHRQGASKDVSSSSQMRGKERLTPS